jgi:anti-sigma regulatory factor (Ser/Thr protein kinase)
MRTGAAAGHLGCFHEAAFYGSDEDFLSIVVPFLEDGLEAGEPTLVAFDETNEKLIRGAMGGGAGLSFLSGAVQYARPAGAIKKYRTMMAAHVAGGAEQIRIVGDVPHPGLGASWDRWARYEATVNHAFDDFPLWGLCPYDTRITPDDVLADVARTHPHIASADGEHRPNAGFEDPIGFLGHLGPAEPDPLELAPPSAELWSFTSSAARDAVIRGAADTGVSPSDVDDLVIAVSEAVANADRYGVAPIRLRLWAGSDRLVVTVTDQGRGPADPFAGLVPARNSTGGLGLWIVHQLCARVTMSTGEDGFTLRMVVGRPGLTQRGVVSA